MATVVVFEDEFQVVVFGMYLENSHDLMTGVIWCSRCNIISNPCEPTTKDPLIPGALFWQTHGQALASRVGSTLEGELLGDFCFFFGWRYYLEADSKSDGQL